MFVQHSLHHSRPQTVFARPRKGTKCGPGDELQNGIPSVTIYALFITKFA